ncbi:Bpu10I restriction endonuclease [Nitrosospira sp. Nsp18]|uniref:Bpu10I family restriction endonuclease n=1 Tax=Nitrosospira sp. Nsp18 TaxID=1855334 RepID=UPI00087EB980|nr:Bpu10I family restriction endonuclease [Nitrosospira sp. Nsp18]SDA14863.1 Bpu10I restriction endonuclease [Nitrosospira sp. Nsp18]
MTLHVAIQKLVLLVLEPSGHPHGSNILTKTKGKLTERQTIPLKTAIEAYIDIHLVLKDYEVGKISLGTLLANIEMYYDLVRDPAVNVFSHQSDFLSSLLPELICVLFRRVIAELENPFGALIVNAQKDMIIECNFDVAGGGRMVVKRKRMDVAIVTPSVVTFNGCDLDFAIPCVCAEIKTNIDKNMLSGIESSVETLKRTFPRVKYFALGEYSDFEIRAQNYASTFIDEILIIRNQKRSEVRKAAHSRKLLSEPLLYSFLGEIKAHLEETAIQQPKLTKRMLTGRLT